MQEQEAERHPKQLFNGMDAECYPDGVATENV